MTDLTTKTAQSLHAEWCKQMREKGFHGPGEECKNYYHRGLMPKGSHPKDCTKGHPNLIPWPDLPESRRQEYLATAKAVLPEIEREITLVKSESRRVGAEIKKLAKLGGTEKDELLREIWNLASQLCPDDTR